MLRNKNSHIIVFKTDSEIRTEFKVQCASCLVEDKLVSLSIALVVFRQFPSGWFFNFTDSNGDFQEEPSSSFCSEKCLHALKE